MVGIPAIISQILRSANIDESVLKVSGNVLTQAKDGSKYFYRTSKDVKQMRGEIESLKALAATCPEVVPRIIGYDLDGKEGGMVTQYFDLGSSSKSSGETQRELARRITKLHQPPPADTEGFTGKYGFHLPTHCGATEQDNTWEENWEVFYTERRLGDLVRRIGDSKLSSTWEEMQQSVIPLLLREFSPAPTPVILHGDLWSGNKGFDTITSQPVIYDPSSYYGHNEADLGIMHMFGGFSADFFDEYHKVHPRSEPYYDQRQHLYELYHHLNVSPIFTGMSAGSSGLMGQHALMFGGGYRDGALRIMLALLDWSRNVQSHSS